jgi:putative transposase
VCPIARRSARCVASRSPLGAFCPIRPNVVWALDFAFDQTSDGRMLKLLNVIDEYSREALAIDTERSIDADAVVACLERLAAGRGAPRLRTLRPRTRVRRLYGRRLVPFQRHQHRVHRSGQPLAERLDRELSTAAYGDELLNSQRFDSLLEAQVLLEDWRVDYNINRPRARLAHPGRVRRGLATPTTAHTRIAGGSTIGIPSPGIRTRSTPSNAWSP